MTLKKMVDNPSMGGSVAANRSSERSFSLVETIVAVSLIAILMIEVSGVHGNAINFADYSRKALQATYLAKRIMSQVEYQASIRSPLKEIAAKEKDHAFDDAPDFLYDLTIEPLPKSLDLMFKMMSGGLLGGDDKEKSGGDKDGVGAMLEQLKGVVQSATGDEPIWIARVSVSWPEGARRSSVDLAMIVTDIKKLEGSLVPLISKGGGSSGAGTGGTGTGGTGAGGTGAGGPGAGGPGAGGPGAGGTGAGGTGAGGPGAGPGN